MSKKKRRKAESLLGPPFHLKDGDTVGIKVLINPFVLNMESIWFDLFEKH